MPVAAAFSVVFCAAYSASSTFSFTFLVAAVFCSCLLCFILAIFLSLLSSSCCVLLLLLFCWLASSFCAGIVCAALSLPELFTLSATAASAGGSTSAVPIAVATCTVSLPKSGKYNTPAPSTTATISMPIYQNHLNGNTLRFLSLSSRLSTARHTAGGGVSA